MSEPHLYRYTQCEQCGKGFKDDCGESFCSSHCEEEYDCEHTACELCGKEVGQANLNSELICEDCEHEEE